MQGCVMKVHLYTRGIYPGIEYSYPTRMCIPWDSHTGTRQLFCTVTFARNLYPHLGYGYKTFQMCTRSRVRVSVYNPPYSTRQAFT